MSSLLAILDSTFQYTLFARAAAHDTRPLKLLLPQLQQQVFALNFFRSERGRLATAGREHVPHRVPERNPVNTEALFPSPWAFCLLSPISLHSIRHSVKGHQRLATCPDMACKTASRRTDAQWQNGSREMVCKKNRGRRPPQDDGLR